MRFVFATVEGLFLRDDALHIKITEGFIHRDHADVFTGLHDAGEHEGFTIPDGGANRGSVDEKLESQGATRAIDLGNKLLGNNASERLGYHNANLVALVGWEDVENPVEGSRGIACVEMWRERGGRFPLR